MEITWKSIGQRCQGHTKKGTQCRLPASDIVCGIASCPYHINQHKKLFHEVKDRIPQDIKTIALKDSTIY